NRRPQRRQMALIEEALNEGRSVVVDNTNPTVEDRAPIIELARAFGASTVGFYFDAPIADCLDRNRRRTGKAPVPDAALHLTLKRMGQPTVEEGFDRLFRVRVSPDGEFVVDEVPEGRVS